MDDLSPLLKGLGKLPHNRDDDQRTRQFYAKFPNVALALRKSDLENKRHVLLSKFPELADVFVRRSHPQAGKLRNYERHLDFIDAELVKRAQGIEVTYAQPDPPSASGSVGRGGRRPGSPVNAKKLRAFRGMYSQQDFAEKCSVSLATIQRGENGGRWSDATFKQVAETLSMLSEKPVTPEDLKNLKN